MLSSPLGSGKDSEPGPISRSSLGSLDTEPENGRDVRPGGDRRRDKRAAG